jgi:hypothetical protein
MISNERQRAFEYMTMFFLGAGFSRPAGLPLGNQLFNEIILEAQKRGLYEKQLKYDLDSYHEYYRNVSGIEPTEPINLEDFVSFLDIQHYLGLRGSDTWSVNGNESQVIIKNLIAFVLHSHQNKISEEKFLLYEKFAEQLKPQDWIFTFNYDTIVEKALKQKGIPYRLYPTRYKKVNTGPIGGNEVDVSSNEIVLLKMHGSINWFDISGYKASKENRVKNYGLTNNPINMVFDGRRDPYLHPLMDEPYPEGDPLRNIYVLERLDEYLSESTFLLEVPVLITPSYNKILYLNPMREFWYGFMNSGANEQKIVIIGYSLPQHDEYIRQPLYWLIRNFQYYIDPTAVNKSRLKIVDLKEDDKAVNDFKSTYRFLDWSESKTKPYFGGFNLESLDIIFGDD